MNIYLKVEILAREIDGRLLLGLVAAERGHRVLLGDVRPMLSHRLWVPPGIFHDKTLTPSTSRLRLQTLLRERGFRFTSQDEEHGLLDEFGTWEDFADRRFSAETLAGADGSFMWGPHDTAALRRLHPSLTDRIVDTGSPRVDLWRPELQAFHAERPLPGIAAGEPFVLFAHQSAIIMDRNPFWERIKDQRPVYFRGDDDEWERGWYRRCVDEVRYLEHLIPAIRATARANPGARIVIRPHPLDADGSWEALVGDIPGLLVTREGTASAWMSRAAVVVHNGSTIGFEAAAAGRPLISYRPTDARDRYVSNRLGRSAATEDELVDLVRTAIAGAVPDGGWHADGGVLTERLGTLDGPLAADRIVDEWERIGVGLEDAAPFSAVRSNLLSSTHRAVGRARTALRTGRPGAGFITDHKFRALPFDEARRFAAGLQRTLGRFDHVRIIRRGRRLIELRNG